MLASFWKGLPTLSLSSTSKDFPIGFAGTLLVTSFVLCSYDGEAFRELSMESNLYIFFVGTRFVDCLATVGYWLRFGFRDSFWLFCHVFCVHFVFKHYLNYNVIAKTLRKMYFTGLFFGGMSFIF